MASVVSDLSSCCNDTDSAFSSDSARGSSSSCCEQSFSSIDSDDLGTCDPVNPFGSFRHKGPLPYSMFEDSSSFSSSPRSHKRSVYNDSSSGQSSLEDSTHIYINLLDRSDHSIVKTTQFWSRSQCPDESYLSPSHPTIDSEPLQEPVVHQAITYAMTPNKRRCIAKKLKKVGQLLHNVRNHNLNFKTLAVVWTCIQNQYCLLLYVFCYCYI